MTKEDEKATIAALLEERRGYELRGEDERVAQVDAQLKHLGHDAEKASKRAARRPAQRQSSTR